MTERTSDERRPSDKDELKINKETVKDLEPTEADEVKGGGKGLDTDLQCSSV